MPCYRLKQIPLLQMRNSFSFLALWIWTPIPNVWQPNSQFSYHSGWLLQCIKCEQFLSPRLSSSFSSISLQPGFRYIWKDIQWISTWKELLRVERWNLLVEYIRTWNFVEVVDQKSVVVLTRSLKEIESQTRLTFVRSQIIKRVLDTKKELCPKKRVIPASRKYHQLSFRSFQCENRNDEESSTSCCRRQTWCNR